MSEAKAKYLAAKAAFEETFEKHLQNGVEFISDQVFIDPEVEIAPGLHGKIPQNQGSQHGKGIGKAVRCVQGRQL